MKIDTHIAKVHIEFVLKTNFWDENLVWLGFKRAVNLDFGFRQTKPKSLVRFEYSKTSLDLFQHLSYDI